MKRRFPFDGAALALLVVGALVLRPRRGSPTIRSTIPGRRSTCAIRRAGRPSASSPRCARIRPNAARCSNAAAWPSPRFLPRARANAAARIAPCSPTRRSSPSPPPTTCAVGAAFELWLRQRRAARRARSFSARGSRGSSISALTAAAGSTAARRGRWSEHATGNALDIAAFVLEDGRRISVVGDWNGEGARSGVPAARARRGLRRVRHRCSRPTTTPRMPIISISTRRRGLRRRLPLASRGERNP